MAGFFAEHNRPITIADHTGHLFKDIVTDPDINTILKYYSCERIKTTSILNRAIKTDSQKNLIDQMKESCFSICTDGSNDRNLEKMNPITVRIFDINQHKAKLRVHLLYLNLWQCFSN